QQSRCRNSTRGRCAAETGAVDRRRLRLTALPTRRGLARIGVLSRPGRLWRWSNERGVMTKEERMKDAGGWVKKKITTDINKAINGMPFHVDFLTALALQESYEVWGRAYQTKTVPEVLELCVGDILDASGGRNPKAFPQSRAVLERAPRGPEMFAVAR